MSTRRIPKPGWLPDLKGSGLVTLERRHRDYRVTTTTPMMGGGVKTLVPDPKRPIRATSINHGLRRFWRLVWVARCAHGAFKLDDHKALYEAERLVWGGLLRQKPDEPGVASAVRLRVLSPTFDGPLDRQPIFFRNLGKHLPKYVVFPAEVTGGKPPHQLMLAPARFGLRVSYDDKRLSDDDIAMVEEAARLWANFGGLGARTTRGMGSVDVDTEVDGEWAPLPHYSRKEAMGYGIDVRWRRDEASTSTAPEIAWERAVQVLADLRNNQDKKWPEARAIRKAIAAHATAGPLAPEARVFDAAGQFPRTQLGLPFLFREKGDPLSTTVQGYVKVNDASADEPERWETRDRLTSPVTLKAYRIGKRYAPAAIRLPDIAQALDGLAVHVSGEHLGDEAWIGHDPWGDGGEKGLPLDVLMNAFEKVKQP